MYGSQERDQEHSRPCAEEESIDRPEPGGEAKLSVPHTQSSFSRSLLPPQRGEGEGANATAGEVGEGIA
jgi:hypothetical protein